MGECSKCNEINKEGSKFCSECGAKLKIKQESKFLLYGVPIILIATILFVFLVPIPYTTIEGYTVKEPYSTIESYTEWVNSKNCDSDRDCYCRHRSWGGLGSCDSCECYRERSVTKYRNVEKERDVTKEETIYQKLTK